MSKNVLKFIGTLALTGLFIAGCGSGDSGESSKAGKSTTKDGEEVNLIFWDENSGPDRTPIWEKLIADFEKKHPNIKVEYVGLPKDEAKSKLDAAIAAKDTPDVASLQSSWLPEFSIRGALLPNSESLK
ncbi:MAG TPA: extracellular solute-binding protein [Thermoanaerobacterales bacterium]|nr:extracellular solute-binding protein [Thermoanaerobacterales bacterium]